MLGLSSRVGVTTHQGVVQGNASCRQRNNLVLAVGLAASQGTAVGGRLVLLDDGALAALSVDLPLNTLGGIPAGLLGSDHGVADAAVSGASLLLGTGTLRLGVGALEVAGDEEGDKEVGQGRQVQDVEPDGKGLAGSRDAGGRLVLRLVEDALSRLRCDNGGGVGGLGSTKDGLLKTVEESSSLDRLGRRGNGAGDRGHGLGHGHLDRDGVVDEGVEHGVGCADEELGDLQRGQGTLNGGRYADVEGGHGVVGVLTQKLAFHVVSRLIEQDSMGKTHHHGMDTRVDKGEHPDGCRHVAHTGPHAHHGAGVVVRLQGRAELALGQDDKGVEDLVELAQVEDPAVKGQALVPQSADVHAAGRGLPSIVLLNVGGGVAKTGGTVELAEAVNGAGQAIGTAGADDRPPQSSQHANKGPCRVDGQEDIVENDKQAEGRSLADGPGLLAGRGVVLVQQLGRDGVGGGNGDGDLGVQCGREDVIGDGKGEVKVRRRDGLRFRGRREVEEGRGRRLEKHRG